MKSGNAVVPLSTGGTAVSNRRRHELEFLPAALEIVETPPSPIGRLGAYCLVAAFTLALIWAWFARSACTMGRRSRLAMS